MMNNHKRRGDCVVEFGKCKEIVFSVIFESLMEANAKP